MNGRATTLLICGLALAVQAACAPLEIPQPAKQDSAMRVDLTPALRPGSGYLCPAFPNTDLMNRLYQGKDDSLLLESLDLGRSDGTHLIVMMGRHDNPPSAYGTDNGWQTTFLCAGVAGPGGSVQELTPPEDFEPPAGIGRVLSVDLGTGSLVALCPIATPMTPADAPPEALWWNAGADRFVTASAPVPCNVITLGRGFSASEFYSMKASSGGAEVQRYGMAPDGVAKASGAPVQVTLPAGTGLGRVWWTAEISAGVFAWVSSSTQGVTYSRTDQATAVNLAGERKLTYVHRDVVTGRFVLVGDQYEVWDAEGTGQASAPITLPASPQGSTAWAVWESGLAFSERREANPMASKLTVPVADTLAEPRASGYEVREIATTPCTTRDTCRRVGEHYLLRTVLIGDTPHGVYLSWPWMTSSYAEMVIAPL